MHTEIRGLMDTSRHADKWGEAMGMWFAIAHVLEHEDGDVPAEWQYRDSDICEGIRVLDSGDFDTELMLLDVMSTGTLGYDDLRHAGNVLRRYTRALRARGEDY